MEALIEFLYRLKLIPTLHGYTRQSIESTLSLLVKTGKVYNYAIIPQAVALQVKPGDEFICFPL